MIRFIIKRHMDNGRTVGTSSFETIDVDVPELEAALTGGGHDHAGSYDLRELAGAEVLPKGNASQQSSEQLMAEFEPWWERSGQFSRAGGGGYEKTFAFNAWYAAVELAANPIPSQGGEHG